MSAELAPYALDPFGPSANPGAYVACEASERARAILERSLDEGRVAAVMGPPGHGKTLLLRLIGGREQDRARVAYVPFSTLEPDELFALVLNEIGVSRPEPPREALVAVTRELAPRGGVVILVDDANAMPEACASALAELYHELGGALRVALAAVQGAAAQRVFRAFGSAIDVVLLAGGMSGREARRYVETRLAYGGARPELVAAFDDATVDALHRASQGVPRRLNQAAEDVVRRSMRGAMPRLAARVAPLATPARAAPVVRTAPTPLRAPAPEPSKVATPPARAVVPPPAPAPVAPAPPSAAPAPKAGERDDGRGILLPEIFDRVPGEPAGAYRIVRGTPVAAPPPPSTVLVTPAAHTASLLAPEPTVSARREAPTPMVPTRPREPVAQLPIRLVGVAGFVLGVLMSVMWMLGRDEPAPIVYGPIQLPPAVPSVVAPAPPARAHLPSAPARRELEPRRPAPPAPAPIAVSINATPWAAVKIDGREVGETPLAGIPLAPGRHVFEARMPDGTTRQQTIEIDAAHKAVAFQ
jgi:type II secretory pathway predicted ATPase ExeA